MMTKEEVLQQFDDTVAELRVILELQAEQVQCDVDYAASFVHHMLAAVDSARRQFRSYLSSYLSRYGQELLDERLGTVSTPAG